MTAFGHWIFLVEFNPLLLILYVRLRFGEFTGNGPKRATVLTTVHLEMISKYRLLYLEKISKHSVQILNLHILFTPQFSSISMLWPLELSKLIV
jgi:hypothetical protein